MTYGMMEAAGPETKKGPAFPQTLISFLVELRRIELLTS